MRSAQREFATYYHDLIKAKQRAATVQYIQPIIKVNSQNKLVRNVDKRLNIPVDQSC